MEGEKAPAGPIGEDRGDLLQEIRSLSGRDILRRLTQVDRPDAFVRSLPPEDFYWMVKKVGDQDAMLLLESASEAQWQYILDLELWHGDRLDVGEAGAWLGRLAQADNRRLVQWLFHEGEPFAYYHLFRSVELIVIENDEERWSLPEGFFSVDGVHYIRAVDPEQRETLERLLRTMSEEDYTRFQALLLGLGGVLPADLEEELYRLRNVRLAEHGFLPYEEALCVYAPLDPSRLESEPAALPEPAASPGGAVPVVPLEHAESGNLFMAAVSASSDSLLQDRVRLEFAGLCNQILSADRSMSPDLETLVSVCRKASSFVNLGLERLCGKDPAAVENILKRQNLVGLFRVGFGLALKVKWEAERWYKGSWFLSQGLASDFWGDYWGGILAGVLEHRPRFFVGGREGADFREFEWLSDLAECLKVIRRLMVLDSLLAKLTETSPFGPRLLPTEGGSFRPLLFNLWARKILGGSPSFSPLTPAQARRFLEALRRRSPESAPPYTMPGFGEAFVEDFTAVAAEPDPEAAAVLKEALVLIWQEFQEEYGWVSPEDLDERYAKFISIRAPRSMVH
ncbi:MAG: DUF6178 family protein [Deltaproteobacteria bacterium]|nr:DUF6178 family protein [Deltaproteobacteria bacterium]